MVNSVALTIFHTLLLAEALASPPFGRTWAPHRNDTPFNVVDTTSGPVRPLISQQYPAVEQYLGVPFAASPVGDLRFAPPQQRPRSTTVLNATSIGPACMQVPPPHNIYVELEPGFNVNGPQSEDCLSLDIYRPRTNRTEKLPVLIYAYGGANAYGSDNETYTQPTPWIQAKQDMIAVYIQYRLNIFGYPNSAALEENNLGLLDIRFAIEWIEKNIEAFGGDPCRMALWGFSAGSIDTHAYTFTNIEDQIIKGTIMSDSTVIFHDDIWQSHDVQQSNFTWVANNLGCSGDDTELLSCMRGKSATDIINFVNKTIDSQKVSFLPVADNKTVFLNYTDRILQKQVSYNPVIIGTTTDEGEYIIDTSPTMNPPNQTIAFATTILDYLCPGQITAKLLHGIGVTTYRYEYAGNFSNISPLSWMGAYHGSYLPVINGDSSVKAGHPQSGNSTPLELAVGSKMQDLWRAFVFDPLSLPRHGWPINQGGKVNQSTDSVVVFPGRNGATSGIEYGAANEHLCAKGGDRYAIN